MFSILRHQTKSILLQHSLRMAYNNLRVSNIYLYVATHLNNTSQIGSFPEIIMEINNISNQLGFELLRNLDQSPPLGH